MKLMLNLWLERKNPLIQLFDATSGDVILQWQREKLKRLMEMGDICVEDLLDESLPALERLGLVQEL